MPITILDLILLGVMLVSGLLAMVRGFMREILSIAAWGAAALVTLYSFNKLLPTAKTYFNNDTVAAVVVVAGVFVGTLIVVSVITVRISDMILDSRIGALDRTLGFLFGLARGLLIVVVAFLFFIWLVPDKQRPDWVINAKSRVVLQGTGDWLMSLLPDDPENTILKKFKKNKPEDEQTDTEPPPPGSGDGYSKPARDQPQEADRETRGQVSRSPSERGEMDEMHNPSGDAQLDPRPVGPRPVGQPAGDRDSRTTSKGTRCAKSAACSAFSATPMPAAITALGLHALQHRGQEAAGIVSYDGSRFHSERRLGLVGDTFSRREVIERLPGTVAVGHVRYSTTGATILRNVQPLFAELNAGGFAVGHNGNLTNGLSLRRELVRNGAMMQSTTDTEVILHLVAQSKRNRFIDRFIEALRAIEGAYALVSLTNKKLIGARDPLGIRPLVLGELDGCPILTSETCALDIIGAKFVRDVEPGEIIVFDDHGAQKPQAVPAEAAAPLHLRIHLFLAAGFHRARPLGL